MKRKYQFYEQWKKENEREQEHRNISAAVFTAYKMAATDRKNGTVYGVRRGARSELHGTLVNGIKAR